MSFNLFYIGHLIVGIVFLLAGGIMFFIGLKVLKIKFERRELFEIQRRFWTPIYLGGLILSLGGVVHLMIHALHIDSMLPLLYDAMVSIGFLLILLGCIRYYQLPIFRELP